MLTILGRYLLNILISVDQLVNTVFGGYPDETISSRLGKWLGPHKDGACTMCRWTAKVICWLLDRIDKDHCADSIEPDDERRTDV